MRLRRLSMNCNPRSCPAVFHETDSDQVLVVGALVQEPPDDAGVGDGERAVLIPRSVFESAVAAAREGL